MINILFYNTLLTGGIISLLIVLVLLTSPALNKRYQVTWRFNVWKAFTVFLIIPIGFILRFVISSEKAQSSITSIKNSVVAAPVSSGAVNFQMIAENQHISIWTKLVSTGPQWIPVIWSVGACVVMIYLICVYIHFSNNIRKNSKRIQSKHIDQIQTEFLATHKEKKPLSVYQSDKIPSPMIVGIFKPAIFIPKTDYTVLDLQIILTHELTHYLRNDLLHKGLFIVALILHWYNPFVHMMTKAAGKDLEMCCDQDSIKGKDKTFKSDYSDVIMSEIINQKQIKGALFACMGGDKKTMEERFKNIFNRKKRKGGIVFLGALAVVVAFSIFAYANDHDVPDFTNAQYQQLLEKTIVDKADADKARSEEKKDMIYYQPYKELENFDELAESVMDENGNYDIYEVYALVGMEPPPQELPPPFDVSEFESNFTAVNNCIEPHILGNGEWAIYSTESGKQWELKKGDMVKLHLFADINRFGSDYDEFGHKIAARGVLKFGYIKGDERIEIQEFKIEDEKQIEFEIQKEGKYNFYLFCPGSQQIIIKWVSIDIK